MTREEAEQQSEQLAREHPDRATHYWIPREDEHGDWQVVKVALPPGMKRDPTRTTSEAKPKPPEPDDPRPPMWRDVGGPYAG